MAFDDNYRELSIGELENANTDRSVNPAVKVIGIMGRTSAGNWVYLGSDAGQFRVSSLGGTFSLSADASGNRVSAIQGDAGLLHVSALNQDANFMHVSGFSPDAGLFRISSIGGSLSLSADASGNRVSAIQSDAGLLHTSAFVDSGSISAKSPDAGTFHVSAFVDSGSVSAKSPDAGTFRVSAVIDNGSVSAKSGDANQFHVSSVQGDAGLLHVSGFTSTASNFPVSSTQGDAGLMHVSASLMPDTTGGLTIYDSISVSSIASVKSTAGSIYGYYAWNTDTKPNYIKFYNLSAGAQIGTDTPKLVVALPASAAANMAFPNGLAGFTAGIMVGAVSAVPDSATSLPTTSAVGLQLFYK